MAFKNALIHRIFNFIFYTFAIVISFWVLGAFFYLSYAKSWVQYLSTAVFLVGLLFSFFKFKKFLLTQIFIGLIICVYVLSFFNPPANNRNWVLDQEFSPNISIDKNLVTIKNFRNCYYRSNNDFDVHWETRIFDLDKLTGVDFIVEPFADWRGLAHTFLSFSFADGEHAAISVEIRREQKEEYSVFAGIYWNYEITYIIGDERDLIGLRANIRKDPVHLYPIKASKIQLNKLFLSMLQRAKKVDEKPEYYNTLFNTCSTNIARHLKENFDLHLGVDFRLIFPGYADEIAYDLHLIDTNLSLEKARETFLINSRSQYLDDSKAWSKQIREHRK